MSASPPPQQESARKKITVPALARMKSAGEKITALTAYDYCSAFAASEAGIEILLVGDSLGMVIQGHDSSLPVTIEDTAYHVRCARRGNRGALLMADLPFMSYYTESHSLENAAVLMREGAQMVKLEGGAWLAETTARLSQARHSGVRASGIDAAIHQPPRRLPRAGARSGAREGDRG